MIELKDLPKFKIGCASIGKIMAGEVGLSEKQHAELAELQARTLPGAKPLTENMKVTLAKLLHKKQNPELPTGAKTYVKEWVKRKLFQRKKDFKAITIEKGLACEPSSINLIGEVYGIANICKNEDFYQNDYMHGEPDIVLPTIARDAKSSWDLFTFPMFEDQIPDEDYWWQLQGYMILLGLDNAALDYTLIDTPLALVQQDLKSLYFKSGGKAEDWNPEAYEALMPNYRFDDIPKELRVKTFLFKKEEWVEKAIIERVDLCQKYVDSLVNEWLMN